MSVLALIPARAGSKGIRFKNLKRLGGKSLIQRAVECAQDAGIELIRVTTDIPHLARRADVISRPPNLAQDDTPMIDVVRHALEQIPGPDDQIIVLLQPTQPFRTPAHVKQAIALLRESNADSVVSVTELPATHHPAFAVAIHTWGMQPYDDYQDWHTIPKRRQDVPKAYRRDGTVYAFWRKTTERFQSVIYGQHVEPLIIPPDDTCELDTEADWSAVEVRWHARG